MKKITLLGLITLFFSCGAAYAQIPLTGKVYELYKHTPLPSIKVQNTRTKDNTLTNAAGVFTIQAKAGDLLVLESFAYQPDTVLVTNARYVEINLALKDNNLKEVKIQNTDTKLGSLKDPSLNNQAVRYLTDLKGTGGVAIRFGYGKGSKEKKAEQLAYNKLATEQIDRDFNTGNISKYVPLKGVDLKQFIALYRPTIKEYKTPGFDLPLYVNDCYKKFVVLTPEQRKLPPLKRDTTEQ